MLCFENPEVANQALGFSVLMLTKLIFAPSDLDLCRLTSVQDKRHVPLFVELLETLKA